jgi:hypothetical protein
VADERAVAAVGLIRMRVAVLAVMMVVLALAAGRIFDSVRGAFVVGAIVPTVLMFPVLARRWYLQLPMAVAAVIGAVVAAVWIDGGRVPADVVDAIVDGPQRLLSTEWPSPIRPELTGAVTALIATASVLATILVSKMRWHLLPLVPPFAAFVVICALSAAQGSGVIWLVPLTPLALLFTVLRPGGPSVERIRILAGERLVLMTVVATGLAVAVSIPVAFADRADPRRIEPAETTSPIIDPIEATIALRRLDPPIVVYDVRATSATTALPSRWRTATLDTYDGQRWTPSLTLRPIGRRLGPEQSGALGALIEFGSDDVAFVPLPGTPIQIGADVHTDEARTVVQLVDRPVVGLVVPVTALVTPERVGIASTPLGVRAVDEISTGFTVLANNMGGDGTVLERLEAIEQTLRDDFALDPGAPGGGMQLALIQRFLTETRRGNAEQFATAFVLLARSIGVNARVATGFVAPRGALDAHIELRSDLARTWPEVEVPGTGWVAFDPVPEAVAPDGDEPPAPPQAQTPTAQQPPIPPPAAANDDDDESAAAPEQEDSGKWSTVSRWVVRSGLGVAGVLLPVVLVAGAIVATKAQRRRRRLGTTDERQRVRATWAVATDALVDAGLTIAPAWTDRQIAEQGAPLAEDAQHELMRLGAMSSAATYGSSRLPPPMAGDVLAAVRHIEQSIRSPLTRWHRLRWRVSTRSLRRATRSPVLGDTG